jgi:DNA-binding NarL/FixJ family response regulator
MQSISILVADSDPTVRRCLRRVVEADPSFRIHWEAENGLQALSLAQLHHPDLVLLAAQMPRMDGMETVRCLRQSGANLRIVIMGVYEHSRSQAIAAGADLFLVKDCGCDAIREAIRQLFIPAVAVTPRGDDTGRPEATTVS